MLSAQAYGQGTCSNPGGGGGGEGRRGVGGVKGQRGSSWVGD